MAYWVPDKVIEALGRALSDIHEGVVSFDADDYEPVLNDWFDNLEEYKQDERDSHNDDTKRNC